LQRIFYWCAQFYTRTDVIKLHANLLGGVHLDLRKAKAETHMHEIKNYLGFEVKGKNYQMLVRDGISEGRADPARRDRVYDATELVAIDTGRIFARGIRDSESAFSALLR
jgi:hypothetical protein